MPVSLTIGKHAASTFDCVATSANSFGMYFVHTAWPWLASKPVSRRVVFSLRP